MSLKSTTSQLALIVLLAGPASQKLVADASQWQGIYTTGGAAPWTQDQSTLILSECIENNCLFSYVFNGSPESFAYETRSYSRPLRIEGHQGIHENSHRQCRIQIQLEQEGLDRRLILSEATAGCFPGNPAWHGNTVLQFQNYRARPSFDCAQEGLRPMEGIICNEPGVALLDARLGRYYQQIRNALPDEDARLLRDNQRNWLRQRNRCIAENNSWDQQVACLTNEYRQRLDQLAPVREYQTLMQAFPLPAMPDYISATGFDELLANPRPDWAEHPRFLSYLRTEGVPEPLIGEITRQNYPDYFVLEADPDHHLLLGYYGANRQIGLVITVDVKSGLWLYTQGGDRLRAHLPEPTFFSNGQAWQMAPEAFRRASGLAASEVPSHQRPLRGTAYLFGTDQAPVRRNHQDQVCFWGGKTMIAWTGSLAMERLELPGIMTDIEQRLETSACRGSIDKNFNPENFFFSH